MAPTSLDFSIVIPMKNEEENVAPLLGELVGVMEPLGSFEVIAVDDGSTDGTFRALQSARQRFPQLRTIKLDKNYGQSAALCTALTRAKGKIVITMDGDMQSDPHDIPKLLSEIAKGADACLTYRARRQDNAARRFQSLVGNGMRNWILRSNIRDTGSQLRAFKASFIADLPRFVGMHRFIGDLLRMCGCRIVQIPTNHRSRHRGVAKYGMGNRIWRGLRDLLAVRWMSQRMIRCKVESEDA